MKKFFSIIIGGIFITSVIINPIQANAKEMDFKNDKKFEAEHVIMDTRTEGELYQEKEKLEIAETTLITQKNLRGIGYGSKYLSYDTRNTPEKQKYSTWCGPAAALNAVDTRSYHISGKNTPYTQYAMAEILETSMYNGTNLDSNKWPKTMNYFAPGNNYLVSYGKDYTSSNWKTKVEAIVATTIDRGFPVIIDVKMNSTNGFLSNVYKNRYSENGGKSIYHYVTIIGYRYSNGTMYIKYLDSYERQNGAYETTLDTFSKTSKELGIIW